MPALYLEQQDRPDRVGYDGKSFLRYRTDHISAGDVTIDFHDINAINVEAMGRHFCIRVEPGPDGGAWLEMYEDVEIPS